MAANMIIMSEDWVVKISTSDGEVEAKIVKITTKTATTMAMVHFIESSDQTVPENSESMIGCGFTVLVKVDG
jgi:hypothetical protein